MPPVGSYCTNISLCTVDKTLNIVVVFPPCRINCRAPWRSWFRHCATSRKVAGSITDNPWIVSASNIIDYLEYLLGLKAAATYA